jgi:hypothetical protein
MVGLVLPLQRFAYVAGCFGSLLIHQAVALANSPPRVDFKRKAGRGYWHWPSGHFARRSIISPLEGDESASSAACHVRFGELTHCAGIDLHSHGRLRVKSPSCPWRDRSRCCGVGSDAEGSDASGQFPYRGSSHVAGHSFARRET